MNSIDFSDKLLRDFLNLDSRPEEWNLFHSRNEVDEDFRKRHPFNSALYRFVRFVWNKDTLTKDVWLERFRKWERHINEYLEIKYAGKKEAVPVLCSDRIDRLHEILGILDTKIGMILTVNSLLLAGMGFLLPFFPNLTDWIKKPAGLGDVLAIGLYILSFAVIVVCISGIGLSLRAFRRVVWGNLSASEQPLPEKESIYAGYLIMSVTRRTNMFRVSTYLLKWAIRGIRAFALLGGLLLVLRSAHDFREHRKPASNTSGNVILPDSPMQEFNNSTVFMPGATLSTSVTKTFPDKASGTGSGGHAGTGTVLPKRPCCCRSCAKK